MKHRDVVAWSLSCLLMCSVPVGQSYAETREEVEPEPSYDVVAGGQNTNITIGVNGNYPFSGVLNASAGIATTSIGSSNLLDLKIGIGTLEPKLDYTTPWSHLFIGQTHIVTDDTLGLGKGDSRYWFFEGFLGLGPIGVGYRFNFMDDEEGIHIGKTHIARNQMFPFLAITSRQ